VSSRGLPSPAGCLTICARFILAVHCRARHVHHRGAVPEPGRGGGGNIGLPTVLNSIVNTIEIRGSVGSCVVDFLFHSHAPQAASVLQVHQEADPSTMSVASSIKYVKFYQNPALKSFKKQKNSFFSA
jgi:hypothetical protein